MIDGVRHPSAISPASACIFGAVAATYTGGTSRGASASCAGTSADQVPPSYFPPGYVKGESWRSLFYANLVHNFAQEICDGGQANQGNFAQSARVQEIINAVERSHRERRWVDLPLEPGVGD